ncbi:MAG: fluoride efflux transporter CrcB [Halieaceae bacterium]|jgi:CrcB protein|nr:fluoride efflux transporter CrcB [Halieaceae bacterium]
MQHLLPIALGGALGAVARYLLSSSAHGLWGWLWPWGTLLVNATGSLAIGVIFACLERGVVHSELRNVLLVGFLGAFTTFSTYALESVELWLRGQHGHAVVYAAASAALCIAAAATGIIATRSLLT